MVIQATPKRQVGSQHVKLGNLAGLYVLRGYLMEKLRSSVLII